MLSTWFAHPVLLLTLLTVPVALAFVLFAHFRRKKMTAQLGSTLTLRKSVLVHPRARRWKTLCILAGIYLLALACAGPQWGLDRDAQHRKGRDVILVLDLSRSMDAEQPSRRELAVRALRHLADTFEEHGGNRVALVVFAARPLLLFPLTQDCDHLRHTLAQIDANEIPDLSVEEPVSGTRIGAALKLAVEAIDPRRTNRPIIVLLSDGDDPADDNEWIQGVAAAKEKQIRVHTVGIGDPDKAENIPAGDEWLLFNGKPISTRLHESLLRTIAHRTDGVYLSAHTQTLPLGTFVQHLLDADELRDEEPASDALPVYQLRYAWFLFPAALFFMLAFFLNEGPRLSRNDPKPMCSRTPIQRPRRSNASALVVVALAIFAVSAADPPSVGSLLRQGNEAFAQHDYETALKFFEHAESLTLDPGLVSFNKAAAYFRLGRHKEAIECYRRCLEDDQSSIDRRARAHFDLGNALVQYAPDNPLTLAEAVAAYRACLYQPNLQVKLRDDARHNLELAQLLWLKVREKLPPDTKNPDDPKYPPQPDDKKDGQESYVEHKPTKKEKRIESDDLPNPSSKPKHTRSDGMSKLLPDDEKVNPLSPEDTLATLAAHARRISQARRLQQNPGRNATTLSTKDW
jgi:Ca-activated chloride channel family protein